MGIVRTWGYLHFNFVIGAPSQHEVLQKLSPFSFKSCHIIIGPMYVIPSTIVLPL
jgi:hypothetical protein